MKREWIKVTPESMPKLGDPVYCYGYQSIYGPKDIHVFEGMKDSYGDWVHTHNEDSIDNIYVVTHWMPKEPLPAAPSSPND